MKRARTQVAALVVAVAAVTAGCVVSDDPGPRMGTAGMMGRSTDVGEADYLAEMVAHHREAVAAAGQLVRSERAVMRAFGESIVETQSAQIEHMEAWLGIWYPDQPAASDYQPMMRDLSGLSGDDLDRVFLVDMIGHHMAAVMMSQHLLSRGADHVEVADLARSIRDDQHTEIVQMERWLVRWFDIRPGSARRLVTSFPLPM